MLQKLTSAHRHFQNLISFAHSPRLQDALNCELSIVLVPAQRKHTIKLPATSAEWRQVIDILAGEFYRFGSTWPETEAQELFKIFSNPGLLQQSRPQFKPARQIPLLSKSKSQGDFQFLSESQSQCQSQPQSKAQFYRKSQSQQSSQNPTISPSHRPREPCVHCECALIEYLAHRHLGHIRRVLDHFESGEQAGDPGKSAEGKRGLGKQVVRKIIHGNWYRPVSGVGANVQPWRRVSAFTYIGVSKLSCTPCQLWIQGYNSLSGPSFYTRGSHGKWYWPWAMPELEKDYLGGWIFEKVSTSYLKLCRSKLRLKNLSDGSTATMTTAQTSEDPEVDDLIEALLIANPLNQFNR